MKNKPLLLSIYLTLTQALLLVISAGHAFSAEDNSFQVIMYFYKVYLRVSGEKKTHTLLPACKMSWEDREWNLILVTCARPGLQILPAKVSKPVQSSRNTTLSE